MCERERFMYTCNCVVICTICTMEQALAAALRMWVVHKRKLDLVGAHTSQIQHGDTEEETKDARRPTCTSQIETVQVSC